jgi:hypothetical protein
MKSKAEKALRLMAEFNVPATWGASLLVILYCLAMTVHRDIQTVALAYRTGKEWGLGAVAWGMLTTKFGLACFGSFVLIGFILGAIVMLITYESSAGNEYREKVRCAKKETEEARQWAECKVRQDLEYKFECAEEVHRRARIDIKAAEWQVKVLENDLMHAQLRAKTAEERFSGTPAKKQKSNNSSCAAERRKRRDRRNDTDNENGINPNPSR